MFGLFKKASEEEKLNQQYKKLLEDAYKLSQTDRKASDAKMAEAEEIGRKLSSIRSGN